MSEEERGGKEPGGEIQPASSGLEAIPGLARVAASAWWHTAEWAVQTSARTGARLVQAAFSPDAAADLAKETGEMARAAASGLGVEGRVREVEDRVRDTGVMKTVASAVPSMPGRPSSSRSDGETPLQERGEELMRRSRDVRYDVEAHPAYERILSELAPDEGRILRLMLLEGPQPAVDVRTGGPLGLFNSKLLAPGLSMIGARAGLRYVDRVPSYLNNLFRLGMVWFSRETLHDAHRYQVIEAQPDVLAAMHSTRFPKLVRRSIHLTPFGVDFCRDALALEVEIAHVEELPVHTAPKEVTKTSQPPVT